MIDSPRQYRMSYRRSMEYEIIVTYLDIILLYRRKRGRDKRNPSNINKYIITF